MKIDKIRKGVIKLLLINIFITTSCNFIEPVQKKIKLVVFTQQLNNSTELLFPQDIKTLFLPFICKDCGDTLAFTTINKDEGILLSRIDLIDSVEIKFDLSSTLGKTVSNNIKRSTKIIDEKFKDLKLTKGFVKENATPDFQKLLKYGQRVVFFDENNEKDSIFINGNYFKNFRSMASLKLHVAEELFNKYSLQIPVRDYAIVYKVPTQTSPDPKLIYNSENIEELMSEANKSLSLKNYQKAIDLFNRIIELQPLNQIAKDRIILINQTVYPEESPVKKKGKDIKNSNQSYSNETIEFVPFYGLSIQEKLSKIADDKISLDKRRKYKDIALQDFSNSKSLVYILTNDTSKLASTKTIDEYLNNLYVTHNYKIFVTEKGIDENGKLNLIRITETY